MLDDGEFRRALSWKGTGTGELREREFGPVLEEYERITGFHETNINAFYHHLVSLYGHPAALVASRFGRQKLNFVPHAGVRRMR